MRLAVSSIVVFFIIFQSFLHQQVGADDGVVSRMERVAELMLSHPDRCGKHGTTESEIIPVENCGDKICHLPDSMCQYNFVSDRFSCFQRTVFSAVIFHTTLSLINYFSERRLQRIDR